MPEPRRGRKWLNARWWSALGNREMARGCMLDRDVDGVARPGGDSEGDRTGRVSGRVDVELGVHGRAVDGPRRLAHRAAPADRQRDAIGLELHVDDGRLGRLLPRRLLRDDGERRGIRERGGRGGAQRENDKRASEHVEQTWTRGERFGREVTSRGESRLEFPSLDTAPR